MRKQHGWYRFILIFTLLCFTGSVGIVSVAAASNGGGDQFENAERRMDVAEVFDAAHQWIPDQSQLVVAAAGPTAWEILGDNLLTTANAEAEPGALGTVEGLRTDIQDVLIGHLGFDPAQSHAVVVAINANQFAGSLVLFGEFGDFSQVPSIDVDGTMIYEIDISSISPESGPMGSTIYALPITDSRNGLVLSLDPGYLAQKQAAFNAEGSTAKTVMDYSRLFEDARGASYAMATTSGELAGSLNLEIPVPEAALVALGDTIRIVMEGDDQALAAIEQIVADEARQASQRATDQYEDRDSGLLMRAASIYVYHTTESVVDQLQPIVGDGTLRYEIALVKTDSLWASVMGPAVAAGSVVAHSAFERYINRSKAAEAWSINQSMADGARAYFERDQQYQSDHYSSEPWHPQDQEHPQRRAGMPVAFDGKVFPGGPNIKVVTSEEIPQDGKKVSPAPQLSGDVDFDAQAVFNQLHFIADEPTYFRYTYETGPGTGSDATARITAEANFDPSTPNHHIAIIELTVDHGGAYATPIWIENEME